MMGNTVIRAEGKPKFAMIAMIIPSVGNLLLDYIFINQMGLGMWGAAWATTASYLFCLPMFSGFSSLKIRSLKSVYQISDLINLYFLKWVPLVLSLLYTWKRAGPSRQSRGLGFHVNQGLAN